MSKYSVEVTIKQCIRVHMLCYTLWRVSVEMDSWKRTRYGTRFRGYEWSTNISLDTDTLYKRRTELSSDARVEAESNTSTVALRVVGGDEKGSLEFETVKYDRESHWTRTREWLRWRGPAIIVNNRSVLSSERQPHINKPVTVWQ
jgi:hypothetical protein